MKPRTDIDGKSHLPWLAIPTSLCLLLVCSGLAVADPGNYGAGAAADAGSQPGGSSPPTSMQIDSLQQQADQIQAEVEGMNQNLEVMVEQSDASEARLNQLTLALADSRQRLDNARAERDAEEQIIYDRLSAIYKSGDVNVMSLLLTSNSINDFYERLQYMSRINQQDQKVEHQFEESTKEIASLTDDLDHQRSEQMQLKEQQSGQEAAIRARIADRQTVLDGVNSQVTQLIQQRQEQQREEQARLAAEEEASLSGVSVSSDVQSQVVKVALQYLGVPYVWGGESPQGFDCSGLTRYVFLQFGVNLPHNAAMQFQLGMPVPRDQLQPGDLLFWGPGNPHHVAIYAGNGRFIEAPTFGETVRVSTLTFDSDYAGARRYPLQMPGAPSAPHS